MERRGEIFFSAYPPSIKENPAIELFHDSLRDIGYTHRQVDFTITAICCKRVSSTLLIIHWPSFFWFSKWYLISLVKFLKFMLICTLSKCMGYKLVWCAHNTLPHNYYFYNLELFARKYILRNFHLIINLAKNASDERLALTGVRPVREVLAIHGNYGQIYTPSGEYSRDNLGIPADAKVIFLHSNMKDYKGDEEFIESFINFSSSNLYLLVMGKMGNQKSEGNKIIFVPGYKTDGQMADLISISDYFALPYKKITTSGAYMLAVTFKKPMIASDLPFFRVHSLPNTTLFYNLKDDSLNKVFEKLSLGWEADAENMDRMKQSYTWANGAEAIEIAVNEMIEKKGR